MNEYIEREKLGIGRCNPEVFEDKGYAKGWNAAIDIIQSAPAADARPVVLCKDCKNDCHCIIQDFMEDYGITPDDQNNFFCGYGEKEDKKDER